MLILCILFIFFYGGLSPAFTVRENDRIKSCNKEQLFSRRNCRGLAYSLIMQTLWLTFLHLTLEPNTNREERVVALWHVIVADSKGLQIGVWIKNGILVFHLDLFEADDLVDYYYCCSSWNRLNIYVFLKFLWAAVLLGSWAVGYDKEAIKCFSKLYTYS